MGGSRIAAAAARSPAVFHALRAALDPGQPARVRAFLAGDPHARLLELGCGIGANRPVTDRPYAGLDLDPGYVAYATRRFGAADARFAAGDLLRPVDPGLGPFDLVALLNVIHHLEDDEVRTALRHARAAGAARALVVDVALERTGFLFRHLFGPLDRGARFRTTDDIRTLLESAGLRIDRADGWSTGPGIWPRAACLGTFG